GRGRDSVAEDGGEHERDRRDEQEDEEEAAHGLIAIVERGADDEEAWAGCRRDRSGRDPYGVREPTHVLRLHERARPSDGSSSREVEDGGRPDLLGPSDHAATFVEHLYEARLLVERREAAHVPLGMGHAA